MRIGLKDKLFILFVISLSVLLLDLSSTSYAYTFDDFVEYCTLIKNGDISSNNDYRELAISFLAVQQNIRNSVNVNNYTNFIVTEKDDSNRNYILDMNNGCTVNDVGANYTNFRVDNITSPVWSCRFSYYGTDLTSIHNYSIINQLSTKITETVGLVDAYNTHGRGLFNLYDPEPDVYFIPNHDFIVSYKGQSNVNALLRNYSINQWKIGETYDFSSLDAFHMYFYDLTNNVELGRVFAYREIDSISGTNALYFSQGNLYVNARYINYKTLYRLNISKFLDNKEYTEEHYFVFAPRNATVQNGIITDFGSGDFTTQDSTNAIINSQESGDAKIIGTLTDASEVDSILSGEFIATSSGDIKNYAEKFGFTVLDNPFTTFLLHVLESTFDALTEPNNVVLQADYKTLHFELDSDDFNLPASPLKDFIRNLLIFLYIYGNYRFFNHLIVLIQTAKIDKAIATLGTDEFYDSDIM